MSDVLNKIICADSLEYLRSCKSDSIHCIITSPPYYQLRDYGVKGQVGLEASLDEFIEKLVLIFRESRRVLHPTGTLWINMGDSYCQNGKWGGSSSGLNGHSIDGGYSRSRRKIEGLKPKDLVGQPWRLAFALQADGWYLRSDIIWHKTNSMPSSVNDRPTTNHEYVFLLSKSPHYYYDKHAIAEPAKQSSIARGNRAVSEHHKNMKIPGQSARSMHKARANGDGYSMPATKNKRTVWTTPTKGFKDAHFATFPEALIKPMILAGCPPKICPTCLSPWERQTEKQFIPQDDVSPERGIKGAPGQKPQYEDNQWDGYPRGSVAYQTTGWYPTCSCPPRPSVPGIVLDPFMGSGTTALVAMKNGRNYMGCDLNPEYVEMAKERLSQPIQKDMFTSAGMLTNNSDKGN